MLSGLTATGPTLASARKTINDNKGNDNNLRVAGGEWWWAADLIKDNTGSVNFYLKFKY